VLKPKDPASLIGSIELAIDASQHVPLRVAVSPRGGGNPAIEVAFTQISFDRPDASQFTFNPPPGARVVEADEASTPDHPVPTPDKTTPATPGEERPKMAVIGTGWTSVLAVRVPTEVTPGRARRERARTGGSVGRATEGEWGMGQRLAAVDPVVHRADHR
jgi:hypothetical protein